MEVLRFFEEIRTDFGNEFFLKVTQLGEETIFIIVGLFFFWCVNKKQGYFILSVGFLGTVINQFLKLLFRIPRPWQKDPNFTIVEQARAEATGYSFPSGHTQSAVGVFGSIARISKKVLVRILCLIVCVLVPISRMYLGVHSLLDVSVSILVAVALVLGLYPVIEKVIDNPRRMRMFLLGMTLIAVVYLCFVHLYPFPSNMEMTNYEHGVQNAYKILGCVLGLWLSYEIDERHTHFSTEGVWWVQIVKLVLVLHPRQIQHLLLVNLTLLQYLLY